jgi:hypothetical protein
VTAHPYEPQPTETARFDQAYAEASERLDQLIHTHRDLLADGEEKREVRIAGLAQWLITECDHPSIAQILAVAATRLVDVRSVEGKRGEGLCDCDGADDDPISPITGEPMDHHCECRAVLTAATLLGSVARTQHAARCLCGRGARATP